MKSGRDQKSSLLLHLWSQCFRTVIQTASGARIVCMELRFENFSSERRDESSKKQSDQAKGFQSKGWLNSSLKWGKAPAKKSKGWKCAERVVGDDIKEL